MMKNYTIKSVLTFALIGISISVAAHDPKEHAKERKAPDCSTMKDMKNMKANDSVAIAMMKKCQKMMVEEMKMEHDTENPSEDKVKENSDQKHQDKH